MHARVLGCGLLLHAVSVMAQSEGDMVVRHIAVDGAARTVVEGALRITVRGADGKESNRLPVGGVLAPGSRIATGDGVLVELSRARPALRVVVEPRTRLTVQQNTPDATRLEVAEGKASFDLLGRLDFYFGVSAFRKVFAIVRGTRFSVDTSRTCGGVEPSTCVTVRLDEGRLDLETRRPILVGNAGLPAAGARSDRNQPFPSEDEAVSVIDAMAAGESRTLALDPAQFALRFETLSDADRHFAGELKGARALGDPQLIMRALRNYLIIQRLADRHAAASDLAEEGLRMARAAGDRLWEFRFLIDLAFSIWRQKRDRSALPFFDKAFAMTDVIEAPEASADLASLYARYGGIRFDARDRQNAGGDLKVAEDYMRRALRLREPQRGNPPTLDLSWSHYNLGVLLRISRADAYAEADRHFERALAIRREVLGARDDIATAEMMADAALAKELLVQQRVRSRQVAHDELLAGFGQVRTSFEESLNMMSRLNAGRDHRSIGAIARRMADFQRRWGDWLAGLAQPAEARAQYLAAESRYTEALDVFSRVSSNTLAERRFAYRGLGETRLLLGQAATALQALQQAFSIALQERCSSSPAVEAPAIAWIADLLALMERAADGSGQPALAEEHRRLRGLQEEALLCSQTGAAGSSPSGAHP